MYETTKVILSLRSSTALTSYKSRVNHVGIWYYFVYDFSQLCGMKPDPMWVMYSGQWSLRRSPSPRSWPLLSKGSRTGSGGLCLRLVAGSNTTTE